MDTNDPIVIGNLEMMLPSGGPMFDLAGRESMGGPLGWVNGVSCATTNFYYDTEGKILEFGNPQDVSEGVREVCSSARFQIEYGAHKGVPLIKLHPQFGDGILTIDELNIDFITGKEKIVETARVFNDAFYDRPRVMGEQYLHESMSGVIEAYRRVMKGRS